ncbi:MAG: surface-adhesin E family protein [Thermodesulfobacteriota bacterium]
MRTDETNYSIVKETKNDEKSYDIWYFVSKVGRERPYKVYVAKASILIENDRRKSWTKLVFNYEQTDEDGTNYKEVYIYSSVNCSDRTFFYIASRFYNMIGELVFSENVSTDPEPILADTVSDYVSKFVCAHSEN